MKLEDMKEFNLPVYDYLYNGYFVDNNIKVGKAVGEAKISIPGNAWVRGFEKVPETEGEYKFNFQNAVSQHGSDSSRLKAKRPLVYVIGIVNENGTPQFAYATSMLDEPEEVNILRLIDLEKITHIRDYHSYSK